MRHGEGGDQGREWRSLFVACGLALAGILAVVSWPLSLTARIAIGLVWCLLAAASFWYGRQRLAVVLLVLLCCPLLGQLAWRFGDPVARALSAEARPTDGAFELSAVAVASSERPGLWTLSLRPPDDLRTGVARVTNAGGADLLVPSLERWAGSRAEDIRNLPEGERRLRVEELVRGLPFVLCKSPLARTRRVLTRALMRECESPGAARDILGTATEFDEWVAWVEPARAPAKLDLPLSESDLTRGCCLSHAEVQPAEGGSSLVVGPWSKPEIIEIAR